MYSKMEYLGYCVFKVFEIPPKIKIHRRKMRPGGPETLDSRNIFKIRVGGRARGALNLKQRPCLGPRCKVASQARPSNSRNSFGASIASNPAKAPLPAQAYDPTRNRVGTTTCNNQI